MATPQVDSELCILLNADADVSGLGVLNATIIQSLGGLVITILYCILYRKNKAAYRADPSKFKLIPALYNLYRNIIMTLILLVVALVVASFTKKTRTTAYHIHMVSTLASLSTGSVGIMEYFTWRNGSRIPWQKWIALLLLFAAWIVSLVFGRWSVDEKFARELACVQEKPTVSGPVDVVCLVLAGILMLSAALVEPVRRRSQQSSSTFCTCYRLILYGMIVWSLGFIVINTSQLYIVRSAFSPLFRDIENDWGLGQVLPLLMLAVPIITFVQDLVEGPQYSATLQHLPKGGQFALVREQTDAQLGGSGVSSQIGP